MLRYCRDLNIEENWSMGCIISRKLEYSGYVKCQPGLERAVMKNVIYERRDRGLPTQTWTQNTEDTLSVRQEDWPPDESFQLAMMRVTFHKEPATSIITCDETNFLPHESWPQKYKQISYLPIIISLLAGHRCVLCVLRWLVRIRGWHEWRLLAVRSVIGLTPWQFRGTIPVIAATRGSVLTVAIILLPITTTVLPDILISVVIPIGPPTVTSCLTHRLSFTVTVNLIILVVSLFILWFWHFAALKFSLSVWPREILRRPLPIVLIALFQRSRAVIWVTIKSTFIPTFPTSTISLFPSSVSSWPSSSVTPSWSTGPLSISSA